MVEWGIPSLLLFSFSLFSLSLFSRITRTTTITFPHSGFFSLTIFFFFFACVHHPFAFILLLRPHVSLLLAMLWLASSNLTPRLLVLYPRLSSSTLLFRFTISRHTGLTLMPVFRGKGEKRAQSFAVWLLLLQRLFYVLVSLVPSLVWFNVSPSSDAGFPNSWVKRRVMIVMDWPETLPRPCY